MMPQEERVHAMVRTGTITEAEGERLLKALRTRRRDLPGLRVLLSPMEYLSPRVMAILAIAATALSVVVERLGIRFDGALDVHPARTTPTVALALFDVANALLMPAVFFWSISWLLARQGRFVDFLLAVGVARVPLVLIGLIAYWALPPFEVLATYSIASPPAGRGVLVMSVVATPLFVLFIVLLYQGFRTSSGLTGVRGAFAFVMGIAAAEVASKMLLAAGEVFAFVLLVAPGYALA